MKTIAQQIKWVIENNGNLVIRNKNGKRIYIVDSTGFWAKWEYDSEGNEIYYKNSNGTIIDNRPKSSEDSVIEIDGVKYKLTKL